VLPERAAEAVRGWSQRKGRIFTDHHVEVAVAHLRASGALERDLVLAGLHHRPLRRCFGSNGPMD
jgi:hypothetical protein